MGKRDFTFIYDKSIINNWLNMTDKPLILRVVSAAGIKVIIKIYR